MNNKRKLQLREITSQTDRFFTATDVNIGNEDIEIIKNESSVVVIDHNTNQGIRAHGDAFVNTIIMDTIIKKTSIFGEAELNRDLTWANTIRTGIIRHDNEIFNVFTNRRGERCYTNGKTIWKVSPTPNGAATEIRSVDCLPINTIVAQNTTSNSSRRDTTPQVASTEKVISDEMRNNIMALRNAMAQAQNEIDMEDDDDEY